MRAVALAVVALMALPGAAGGKPAPAPAGPAGGTRVALAPLTSLTEGKVKLGAMETVLGKGLGGVPGFEVVAAAELHKALKKAKRPELDSCEGEAACLAELGKLVSASVVVAGEVSELAEGSVVYLKAIDVAGARETGSTTAVLPAGDAAVPEARAAAYRLLAPKSYTGTIVLTVDVTGATIYVDGARVAKSPAKPLMASVGTHAVRITHEKYRDFVRFVDVKFDQPTAINVDLKAFPVITDAMREKDRPRPNPVGPVEPLPWYRKWWAVAGAGVILATGATILVFALYDPLSFDQEVTVGD